MSTSKKTKSNAGFTLTEMVIVIAVIAILAAVLIPTFIGVSNRAKLSADTQTAANATIASKTVTSTAPQDVWNAVAAEGLDLTKTQSSGYRFAYAVKGSTIKNIVLLNEKLEIVENEQVSSASDVDLWFFVSSDKDIIAANKLDGKAYKANYFLTQNLTASLAIPTLSSFDTGSSALTGGVFYGDEATAIAGNGTVNVSGNIAGTLFINAPNAEFNQTGSVNTVNAYAVASNSLTINGTVKEVALSKGRVKIANGSVVQKFVIPATAVNKIVQVVNEGYITKFAVAKAVVDAMSSYTTTVVVTNTVGAIEKAVEVNASTGTEQAIENASLADEVKNSENYRYQISTKEDLATFRDAVNNGSTFEGLTVKLMNNITLDAGWAPIGAFKRGDVLSGSQSTFMGTFDGNGKTISNLTNAGYIPTALFNNESTFSEYEYTYGLFATTKNATINNLTVNANINIPTSLGASITGECVGIIVGYAAGSLSLDGCVAKGSVSSYNNVGGLVGAIYATDTDKNVSIKNSTNEANVTSQSKAGGIVGFLNTSKGGIVANFVATVNKGNVTAYNTVDGNVVVAGGICAYGTNPFGGQSQITLLNVRNEGVVSASRSSGNTGVIQANAFTISWQTAQSCAGFEGFTTFSTCVYTQKVVVSGTAQDTIKVDSVVGGSTVTYAPNTIIG